MNVIPCMCNINIGTSYYLLFSNLYFFPYCTVLLEDQGLPEEVFKKKQNPSMFYKCCPHNTAHLGVRLGLGELGLEVEGLDRRGLDGLGLGGCALASVSQVTVTLLVYGGRWGEVNFKMILFDDELRNKPLG